MDMDTGRVCRLLGDSSRFISPFSEPYGYYIWTGIRQNDSSVDKDWIEQYWEHLEYAVKHADALILQVFLAVSENRELVGNIPNFSADMHQKLRFESFVLDPEHEAVGCCLSSPEVMAGHFIDCWWAMDWQLISVYYC